MVMYFYCIDYSSCRPARSAEGQTSTSPSGGVHHSRSQESRSRRLSLADRKKGTSCNFLASYQLETMSRRTLPTNDARRGGCARDGTPPLCPRTNTLKPYAARVRVRCEDGETAVCCLTPGNGIYVKPCLAGRVLPHDHPCARWDRVRDNVRHSSCRRPLQASL